METKYIYKVNQGTNSYQLTLKIVETKILFSLQTTAGQTFTKLFTVEELRGGIQHCQNIQTVVEAIKMFDQIFRKEKVAFKEANGNLKIVILFSDGKEETITLQSGAGMSAVATTTTTTTTTDALLTTTNVDYQIPTEEETFGDIERIVPNPELRQSHAETIDLDKILGVVNKEITTTTVRKSLIPEDEPIKIASTTVETPPMPVQQPEIRESLPIITPADPLPEEKAEVKQEARLLSHSITYPPVPVQMPKVEESLPIITPAEPVEEKNKVLPIKYLPPKILKEGEDISQIIASIDVKVEEETTNQVTDFTNLQTTTDFNFETTNTQTTTDFNFQTTNAQTTTDFNFDTTNAQTTTDFNFEATTTNEATANIDINQYLTQGQQESTEKTFSISLPKKEVPLETQNADDLLRPSLKILQPKITQTVLPPLVPEGEGFDANNFGTGLGDYQNQDFATDDLGTFGENNENALRDQEIKELREENKMIKEQINELIGLKSQINEIDQLKSQIEDMNRMSKQIEELSALKEQVSDNEKLKQEIDTLKSEKMQYEKELTTLKEKQMAEAKVEKIQVKGDIIENVDELEMITRKINRGNKKITLNLIYKASVDSDKAEVFHDKCDGLSSSLVLVKSDKGKRFGGFTTCSWEGDSIDKEDPDAFVFSLDKMVCYDNIPGENAIACYPKFGPVFSGCQIKIYDEAFTKGGSTYEKGLNYNTEEDFELTGGDKTFGIKEIEVYEVLVE